MAVTYKDIDQLTEKASAVGTEKIVVSDTEYITPRKLAGRITGFVGSNTSAMATQWVVATTNLAAENSHRFVFEVIGNSYDGYGPIHSVIQAVNSPSQSAFISGWSKAVNLGKTMTFYVANVSGYITLYFQIIHGVSVWVSCHSGANLDNRVTSVVLQDSAPSYTWRATATNTNYLPLSGGTLTGAITPASGQSSVNWTADTLTANSIVKSGGTSSQYLRADGSVGSITISSSEPTSSQGNDGDIWIVI